MPITGEDGRLLPCPQSGALFGIGRKRSNGPSMSGRRALTGGTGRAADRQRVSTDCPRTGRGGTVLANTG
jgi:hypothetical protein